MTTAFKPLTLPPGVVATATKKMSSTNYAEVNMVRWVEGQLAPIGGQTKYNFSFASRCKAIHGFYDLSEVYHIAYLCETNLYVDTGGVLLDITPLDGRAAVRPTQGGYGDGLYLPAMGSIPIPTPIPTSFTARRAKSARIRRSIACPTPIACQISAQSSSP